VPGAEVLADDLFVEVDAKARGIGPYPMAIGHVVAAHAGHEAGEEGQVEPMVLDASIVIVSPPRNC
jgi:hypothetical protein